MRKAEALSNKNRKRIPGILILPVFLILLIVSYGLSDFQQNQPEQKTNISISASVDQTKIPLNRMLKLKVTLAWIGEPGTFTVLNFNDPVLSNLEVTGTSISNRTEAQKKDTRVIREYEYSLKAESLGMAYVDSISVKVLNNQTDTEEILQTRRIPVEIVDPIPEKNKERNWLLFLVMFLTAAVITFLSLISIRKKKQRDRAQPSVIQEPLENKYLDELRNNWDLDNLNLREDFSALSRLLRRFLTEKFKIRAMEATTDELVEELKSTAMQENQIQSVSDILSRTDEIKFSGIRGKQEEFTRFYTLIEGMLETYLHKPETAIQPSDKNNGEETQ